LGCGRGQRVPTVLAFLGLDGMKGLDGEPLL